MRVGVLGGRVLFHVLTQFGRSDLAFQMITRPDFPSYGDWVRRGATTLWENFFPEGEQPSSMNHHFWGDISGWFIQALAGIRVNPKGRSVSEIDLRPSFIPQLSYAEGFPYCSCGKGVGSLGTAEGHCAAEGRGAQRGIRFYLSGTRLAI